ncbi:MAG TPA: 3'-5' exonuclease [Candidatus Sulfotelmatobacter sp.]
MPKLLCVDFETTGLDTRKDEVTEVGAVLWDSVTKQPTRIFGYLVKTKYPVSAEITKITGITNEMLESDGVASRPALETLLRMAKTTNAIVAHNGNDFDKPLLESWCGREGLEPPKQFWLDTKIDLPSSAYEKGTSMFVMAAAHGFLYDQHRSVSDCLATLKVLSHYDIDAIMERAKLPSIACRAVVDYSDRLLAKEAGFHWKPDQKLWVRNVKLCDINALKEQCNFPIVQMESK